MKTDYSEAEKIFNIILNSEEEPEAYWGLAQIRIKYGKFQNAINYLKKSIQNSPNEVKYLYDLSFCLINLGEIKEGLNYYEQAYELKKDNYIIRIKIANLLLSRGEFYYAVKIYKQLYQLFPDNANINLNLGAGLDKLNDYDGAMYHFEKAIKISPDFSKAYFNLATVQEKINQGERAKKNYINAIIYDKKFPQPYFNLGLIYFQNNEFTKALEMYDKYILINPNNPRALRNRCLIKGILGLFEGARRDAMKIKSLPNANENDLDDVRSTYYHTIAFEMLEDNYYLSKKIPVEIKKIENLKSKNIDIVTFYVPSNHEYSDNKTSKKDSWDFFLKNFYIRCKKVLPNSNIILLTTNDAILPADLVPYKIIRIDADPTKIMYTRLLAQIKYLESRHNNTVSLFLDLDVFINKIPYEIIEFEHDVSLTVRGFMPPVNAGVFYLSESVNAIKFLNKTKNIYDILINKSVKVKAIEKADFRKWWGDQISMCVAASIIDVTMLNIKEYILDEIRIKLLDCEKYNYDPKIIDQNLLNQNLGTKYFIHFKGDVNSEELQVLEKFYAK